MNPVDAFEPGRASVYLLNNADHAIDFHPVSYPDRALPHQYPATDKIVDDVLRAEPNTDRQGPRDEGEGCQWYIEQIQCGNDENRDYQNIKNSPNEMHHLGSDFPLNEAGAEFLFQPSGQEKAENEEDGGEQDLTNRELMFTQRQHNDVQNPVQSFHDY